jgi:hypothetical protein
VNSRNHLDVLELSAVSQMAHLHPNVFFQQDGVPPDWDFTDRVPEESFSKRIGRDESVPWLPRSGNIIPLDFFFWGCVKDPVFRTDFGTAVELVRE